MTLKDADEEEEPSEDAPPEPEPTRSSARTRPGTRRTASNPSLCKKASSSSLVQQESKPPPVPPLPAHCQQPCSVTSAPSIHAHTDVHFRQDYSCAQSMAIYSDANPRYTSPFNYPPTSQNYFHPHDTSHLGMLPPTSLPYSNGHVDYLQS